MRGRRDFSWVVREGFRESCDLNNKKLAGPRVGGVLGKRTAHSKLLLSMCQASAKCLKHFVFMRKGSEDDPTEEIKVPSAIQRRERPCLSLSPSPPDESSDPLACIQGFVLF